MKILPLLVVLTTLFVTATRGQDSRMNPPVADQNKKVCIVGNVIKPREILFDKSLTITDAIKQAGGIRPDKRDNEVIVISQMIGGEGRVRIIYVDLKAIEKKSYMDLDLQDLDIIEVLSRKPDKVRETFVNPCPWVPVFKDRL
jgi:protein involved in polysaccharide export with SLBB domain